MFANNITIVDKRLTIYTASAGSGKTYTLTQEYIALALSGAYGGYRPDYFRRILAITFTRKATREMKARIVKELYRLASGKSIESYVKELGAKTSLHPNDIRQRASKTLVALLTDYSSFRVRTIDSFFEEILRSFASEIGYSTRYKVELEETLRIRQATQLLLSSLDSYENTRMRVEELIDRTLSEGERQNVEGAISSLGAVLFAEASIDTHIEGQLPDADTISRSKMALGEYIERIREKANKPRQFSKERVFSPSAEVLEANLTLLGTLADLRSSLRAFGKQSNSMLLNSSQSFIREIIDKTDVPFIYERVGTQLAHYLIDEFQDTSQLQFQNLVPLIADSLHQGYSNLVVGDIKQSIYLFRNCDRTILSEGIYKQFPDNSHKVPLKYNWRSAKEIVAFNNALYKELPQQVASQLNKLIEKVLAEHEKCGTTETSLVDAPALKDLHKELIANYADVEQKVPDNNKAKQGGVEVRYYQDKASPLDSLPVTIIDLIDKKGYRPCDIAILCFKNREVGQVAKKLLECVKENAQEHPEYASKLRFAGSETLRITNSPMVRFVISLLRSLASAEVSGYKGSALLNFEKLFEGKNLATYSLSFDKLYDEIKEAYKYLNLYDLVEQVMRRCSPLLEEGEMPYMLMLLDLLVSFSHDETGDLYSFLYWWDERGYKTDLPQEKHTDAISLLTLHKAKGLEFPIVLLPFANWDLAFGDGKKGGDLLRVSIPLAFQKEVGCSLEAAYVKRTDALKKTIFVEAYYREMLSNLIDRLNLFYVATTRAEYGLVLWLPEGEAKKPTSTQFPLAYFLQETFEAFSRSGKNLFSPIPNCLPRGDEGSQKELHYQLPSLVELFPKEISGLSIRYTGDTHFEQNKRVKYGATMHEIMSRISTKEDIPSVVEEACKMGKLPQEDAEKAIEMLSRIVTDERIAPWFSPEAKCYTEQAILSPKKIHFARPDRIVRLSDGTMVVVEYKFGQEQTRYKHQVKHYCELLSDMGNEKIAGYLLYLCNEDYTLQKVYSTDVVSK